MKRISMILLTVFLLVGAFGSASAIPDTTIGTNHIIDKKD